MIPSMNSIITAFGACQPAIQWAGDMDVQTGWEVCTEPGWLMLLGFHTHKHKDSVGGDKYLDVEYQLIQNCFRFIKNQRILDAVDLALKGKKKDMAFLQQEFDYAVSYKKDLWQIIKNTISNQSLWTAPIPEYLAVSSCVYFLNIVLNQDNPSQMAKAGNSAIDSCVNALLAERYPDYIGPSFCIGVQSDKKDIEQYRLLKKLNFVNS